MIRWVEKRVEVPLEGVYHFLTHTLKSMSAVKYLPKEFSTSVARFEAVAIKSVFLVGITSFFIGTLMTLQFSYGLKRFGGDMYVPTIVTHAFVKALGPILAAILMAARAGGGVASELASMAVTQQIDAVKTLGSSAYQKLVLPIVTSFLVGLPALMILSVCAGLLGCILISTTTLKMPYELTVNKMIGALGMRDIYFNLFKSAMEGVLIAVIATYFGMNTRRSTFAIGISTTRAIVSGILLAVLADLVMSNLYWAWLR